MPWYSIPAIIVAYTIIGAVSCSCFYAFVYDPIKIRFGWTKDGAKEHAIMLMGFLWPIGFSFWGPVALFYYPAIYLIKMVGWLTHKLNPKVNW